MCNIAVVGAGIVGLTTAFTLKEKLGNAVNIAVFAEKKSPNTTGDVAAGVLAPYVWDSMRVEDSVKWTKATIKFCHKLWLEGLAEKAGISLVPVFKTSLKAPLIVPEVFQSTFGCTRLSEDHLQEFNKQHNQNFRDAVQYVTFTCEPSKLLPFLEEQILKNGVSIKERFIADFKELSEYDVIINCTGVKAGQLTNDPLVQPIRGQVTRVKAPWQFYGILAGDNYVIPNQDSVILGGTEQHGDYDLTLRQTDQRNILNACYKLIPSLKGAELLRHNSGLRPGRDRVRIEIERKEYGDKIITVIHNYGHAGNGVTLSIGCAEETVDLVKSVVHLNQSKL